ncbi:recombinase RecT [Aquaspirillum soli]
MSNITTQQKGGFSLSPQSLDEAIRFADMLSKSSMVPKDYQGNPANCIIAMQWGMEIGLQPLQAMQNIAVINGRPSIWGDAMLAIVRGSGLLEYIKEDPTPDGCVCRVKRKGEDEAVREFTTEDAKRAGLLGKQGPWQQNPKRMMQMRARAFALRDVFPDVLRGVHVAEIAHDEPPEKDITAESQETSTPLPPKKGRANNVRAALAKIETVSLEDALKKIEEAQNQEELTAVGENVCPKLAPDDRPTARAAFKRRQKQLNDVVGNDMPSQTLEKPESLDNLAAEISYATNNEQIEQVLARGRAALTPENQQLLEKVAEDFRFTDTEA